MDLPLSGIQEEEQMIKGKRTLMCENTNAKEIKNEPNICTPCTMNWW